MTEFIRVISLASSHEQRTVLFVEQCPNGILPQEFTSQYIQRLMDSHRIHPMDVRVYAQANHQLDQLVTQLCSAIICVLKNPDDTLNLVQTYVDELVQGSDSQKKANRMISLLATGLQSQSKAIRMFTDFQKALLQYKPSTVFIAEDSVCF
jgi:hypothetical protein